MSFLRFGSSRHCDPSILEAVVREEANPKDVQRATVHLASCAACQKRLTQISANAPWWEELPQMLATPTEETHEFHDQFSWAAQAEFVVKRLVDSGLIVKGDGDSIGRLDRYELEETLGLGGTGIVFRAKDIELGRVVAVKVLSPDLAVSNAARRRFAREGQACAAVAHENVVAIHHVHSTRNVPYLVMQFVDGASLDQIIAQSGPLDTPEALRIISQVAAGLSAAHQRGIVHRDVKPANVLIESAGQRAWISDFGLARAVDDVGLTRTGFVAGTPHYMSPEQARGASVCARSDLFGLGSVLYFMLTGHPPFRAEKTLAVLNRICEAEHVSVRKLNPAVPSLVAALVDDLLAKRIEDRPESAEEVCRRCIGLMSQSCGDVESEKVKTASGQAKRSGSRKLLVAMAGCVVLCCAGYLLGLLASAVSPGAKHAATRQAVTRQADKNSANSEAAGRAGSKSYDRGKSPGYVRSGPVGSLPNSSRPATNASPETLAHGWSPAPSPALPNTSQSVESESSFAHAPLGAMPSLPPSLPSFRGSLPPSSAVNAPPSVQAPLAVESEVQNQFDSQRGQWAVGLERLSSQLEAFKTDTLNETHRSEVWSVAPVSGFENELIGIEQTIQALQY